MISSLILALGLMGQCSTGSCQIDNGYTQSYYQPSYGYYHSYYQPVYVEPTLHLIILNVPGGTEKTRTYAKCKIYNKFYNIPVINKVLPAISKRNDYEFVLNYENGVPFKYSLYGEEEYINYDSVKKVKGPMAVKDYDTTPVPEETTKVKNGPSGLKHPDSLPPKPTIQKSTTLPSNEEIDALLKRPSTIVPSENSLFPRY